MKEWLPEIATSHELHMLEESAGFYLNSSSDGISFAEYLVNKLIDFVDDQPAVISGMGSQIIFAHQPDALHVRIMGSMEARTKRMMDANNLTSQDTQRIIEMTDRKRKRYLTTLFNRDWSDPLLYHMTLNTDYLTIKEAVSLIHHVVKNRDFKRAELIEKDSPGGHQGLFFKHPSEEEFARILDMYDLEWEYEPRTFPIEWDAEGNITLAFSPDFYLPRFDTYIELTTMNQKYTSVKKKKVELLKKLYPGTNINIVYKNDFHSLIERFGMLGGGDH
jgi:cytidylate kinase